MAEEIDCSDLIGDVQKAVAKTNRVMPIRQLEFDQRVADIVCERISQGRSLRSIIRDDDTLPSCATIFKWLDRVPAFAEQYARAREAQADALVDDMLDIADDKTLDPKDRRVRIDTRKWLAGKMRPKKYGDKTLLGNDPDNPLPENGIKVDVVALAAQLRSAKALGGK